jgi:flagellar biosynthesis protein FliR
MIDTSNQLVTYSASLYNVSPTLLPEQIANVITAIALTARLSIRCSSLLIEALLESVKYSTSFSFGVSRHVIINALSTAKKFHELAASNTSNNTSLSIDRYKH